MTFQLNKHEVCAVFMKNPEYYVEKKLFISKNITIF